MGYRHDKAARCKRCHLAAAICLCDRLPCLDLRTRVVLVMHRREATTTTATGPVALAALPNHELHLHGVRDAPLDLSHLLGPAGAQAETPPSDSRRILLLYPGPTARVLTSELLAEDTRPITLVVPDGSWRQARRAGQRITRMISAEPVTLPEGPPTEWGLRREPKLGGLSTFEAMARSLGIIEGSQVQQQLEELFREMVSRQRAQRPYLPGAVESPEANDSSESTVPILYSDEHLVAVNKPSGYLVHRGWAKDGPVVLQILRDQIGKYLFPVHRLDRATSGVLLFALSSEVARNLQEQLESGDADKRYWALCRGCDPQLRLVDHPLTKEPGSGEKRPARTALRLQGASGRYGLYEARPLTGRTHQIRRHLKHASHPIIGDVRYGKGEHNRLFRERHGFQRLALHCHSLRITHPVTGLPLELHAPLAADFARLLRRLDLSIEPTAGTGLSDGYSGLQ